MTKQKTLLLDGSNIAYRVYYAMAGLSHGGIPTSVIFGLPNLVCSLISQFKPDRLIVVWDGKRSSQRLEWFPEYKGKRKATQDKNSFNKEEFFSQLDKAKDILSCLGVHQVHNRQIEADDYIYHLAKKFSKKGICVVVSNDSDFYQLIGPKIRVWNDNKKKLINHKNFEKIVGYPLAYAEDYHILTGDKSDNINGYPQVGEKRALDFLKKWGSIEDYLSSEKPEEKLIKREKLKEIYELNRKLVNLAFFHDNFLKPQKAFKKSDYKEPQINTAELKIVCAQFGITTFIKPHFLRPFKELYYA